MVGIKIVFGLLASTVVSVVSAQTVIDLPVHIQNTYVST
jgi:hypothetical protein